MSIEFPKTRERKAARTMAKIGDLIEALKLEILNQV